MRISVKHDFDRVGASITADLKRRLPLAAAKALTFTAERVRTAEIAEMRKVFDRPTTFTLNALRLKSATPQNLEAVVWVKDEAGKGTPAINFLGPHIFGGIRRHKRMESALRSAGILTRSEYAVPGAAVKLDRFGNVRAGEVVRILSQLRIQRSAGFESRMSRGAGKARAVARAGGQYVVASPGRGRHPRGIWKRLKRGGIEPIFIFVRGVRYRKRFDFFGVANRVARAEFPALFRRAVEREASKV